MPAPSSDTVPRFRATHLFPPVHLQVDERQDGVLVLTTGDLAVPPAASLAAILVTRADEHPDKPFVCARDASGDWESVTYGEMKDRADRIAGWFATRRPTDREERVLVVTGNSVAHAELIFGASAAGVPICPVSAQYALSPSGRYGRLAHVVDVLYPTVVFAERVAPVAGALMAVLGPDVVVVCRDPESWPGAVGWDEVLAHPTVADPDAAIRALEPDTPLRYMLTSGSTGLPKVVVQTHRMWCTLMSGATEVLAEASGWGVRTLDWMPWSHVAGASVLMGSLANGGTFYLDDGRPTPELFGATLRNLAEVQPLFFANVPAAFAMLCDAVEADPDLRARFYEHLQLCLFGGAGLPQPVYDRFQRMAEEVIGERIMFTTGYGATETTAGVMSISWPTTEVGVGLPVPGVEVKLVPVDDERFEARFRGDCVMAGYLDDAASSAAVFDDEGFYRSGDTLTFVDSAKPELGLVFAGRLAEEFKLLTGTFVPGGRLRAQLVASTSPVILDAVVCGEGRTEVGVLVWVNPVGCAAEIGVDGAAAELANDPRVLDWIGERIRAADADGGSSERIARFAVLVAPPDAEIGEVSDKGTINQSIALRHRSSDVDRLYAGGSGVRVLAP
jgi:feruloyl-CoA synthase